MMQLQAFGLYEYLGFVMIMFLLITLDAVITNIVARAAGTNYHRVESLPWAKWSYKKYRNLTFAMALHFLVNFILMVVIILLPIKASYILFFIGMFFLRVWSMGYKAYFYARGYL
jgi:hypothetical protein